MTYYAITIPIGPRVGVRHSMLELAIPKTSKLLTVTFLELL